jgi:hypothetical protein
MIPRDLGVTPAGFCCAGNLIWLPDACPKAGDTKEINGTNAKTNTIYFCLLRIIKCFIFQENILLYSHTILTTKSTSNLLVYKLEEGAKE